MYLSTMVQRSEILLLLRSIHLATYAARTDDYEFQLAHAWALLAVAEGLGVGPEFLGYLKTIHQKNNFVERLVNKNVYND